MEIGKFKRAHAFNMPEKKNTMLCLLLAFLGVGPHETRENSRLEHEKFISFDGTEFFAFTYRRVYNLGIRD